MSGGVRPGWKEKKMYQKENNSWLKHTDFVILDIICIQIAFFISYLMRVGGGNPYLNPLYGEMAVVLSLLSLCVSFFCESFTGVLKREGLVEFKETLVHTTLVMLISGVYLFLSHQADSYSRMAFMEMWILYAIFTFAGRVILKVYLNGKKGEEGEKRSLLIVTTSSEADKAAARIRENNYGKFHLAGLVLLDCDKTGSVIQKIPVVAGKKEAISYIHKNWVDEVFFALPKGEKVPEEIMKDCRRMGVVTHTYLAVTETLSANQFVEEMAGFSVLSSSIHLVTPRQLFIKRMMDIAGGLVGCIATGIIWLFVAPVMKIKSPGPVFFAQTRMGKNGRPFKIYKFRSMYMDAEERKKELMAQNNVKDGMMFKMDDDPRIIKGIGHFIRKTSLDEFPQFWNILKGDMSLVGTRPPTLDEWEKYELHHRKRLAIKPGLTGMWQVSGRSDITDFEEVVELDTKYIVQWSLLLDIKILFKTFMVVFAGSGAK